MIEMKYVKYFFVILKKPEFYFVFMILVIISYWVLPLSNTERIELIKDVIVLESDSKIKFEKSWFDSSCKVVVYFKGLDDHISIYVPYFEKYPDVIFLFYYDGTDSSAIKRHANRIGFNYPILMDKKGLFAGKNNIKNLSFISFIMSEGHVELSNPTLSNFEDKLKKCI